MMRMDGSPLKKLRLLLIMKRWFEMFLMMNLTPMKMLPFNQVNLYLNLEYHRQPRSPGTTSHTSLTDPGALIALEPGDRTHSIGIRSHHHAAQFPYCAPTTARSEIVMTQNSPHVLLVDCTLLNKFLQFIVIRKGWTTTLSARWHNSSRDLGTGT